MKVFLIVYLLLLNETSGEMYEDQFATELTTMDECEALAHQEAFTQNIQKSYPNAIMAAYDCQEVFVGDPV